MRLVGSERQRRWRARWRLDFGVRRDLRNRVGTARAWLDRADGKKGFTRVSTGLKRTRLTLRWKKSWKSGWAFLPSTVSGLISTRGRRRRAPTRGTPVPETKRGRRELRTVWALARWLEAGWAAGSTGPHRGPLRDAGEKKNWPGEGKALAAGGKRDWAGWASSPFSFYFLFQFFFQRSFKTKTIKIKTEQEYKNNYAPPWM